MLGSIVIDKVFKLNWFMEIKKQIIIFLLKKK